MPSDRMKMDHEIDLSILSREQLAALAIHWQARCGVLVAATYGMADALSEAGDLNGESCQKILEAWAETLVKIVAEADQELGKIIGKTPPPPASFN